jgi:hypothetical protein
LESSVDDLKRGQTSIQNILSDLVATLRSQGRLSSSYSPLHQGLGHAGVTAGPTSVASPIIRSGATPVNASQGLQLINLLTFSSSSTHPAGAYSIHPPPSVSTSSDSTLPPIMSPPVSASSTGGMMYTQGRAQTGSYPSQGQSQSQPGSGYGSMSTSNTLPPISALHTRNPPDSSTRYTHFAHQTASPLQKRSSGRYPDSNVTSAHSSSDEEEEGMGASGLVAPLEVLRELADAAVASKVCFYAVVINASHLLLEWGHW